MASVKTRTIVFKHNEDYLNDIGNMVKERGATKVFFTPSDRWFSGPTFKFTDADGKDQKFEKSRITHEYQM